MIPVLPLSTPIVLPATSGCLRAFPLSLADNHVDLCSVTRIRANLPQIAGAERPSFRGAFLG